MKLRPTKMPVTSELLQKKEWGLAIIFRLVELALNVIRGVSFE